MLHKNWMRVLVFTIVAFGITLYVVPTALPPFPTARGASRTIFLIGYYQAWNNSQPSGPNPTITVTQGDSITIQLSSGDIVHQFLLDFDGDGVMDTADCSPTVDICSGTFSTTPASVSFTASTPGTYMYYCTIHWPAMIGKLVVQPPPTPNFTVSSNPSSLTIVQGSNANSTITVTNINGFTGSVDLSATTSDAGITATPVPLSINSFTNSTLTVKVAASENPGFYSVDVMGKSGSLIHHVTISVTVPKHATTTVVTCSGNTVVVNEPSTCTGTVSDTSSSGATTPTGSVSFTPTGAGSLSAPSCALIAGSCSVIFTPSATGAVTITSSYGGDSTHNTSVSAPATITVNPRSTKTTVTCDSPVVVNQASRCAATVTDNSTAGALVTPMGIVSFTYPGAVSPLTCTLVASSTLGTAACTVNFTPSVYGTAMVTANYGGDSIHKVSVSAPASIMVNFRSTETSVTCVTPATVNQASDCVGTVIDISAGTAIFPTGRVSFVSTDVAGSFSGSPCILTAGSTIGTASCDVSFTSSHAGSSTVTAIFAGESVHSGSTSPAQTITVNPAVSKHDTTSSITCTSPVVVNQESSCTTTVTDASSPGSVTTPTGSVSFMSSSSVSLATTSCTLTAGSTGTASCHVSFTATATGTATVSGNYLGDSTHNPSTSFPASITATAPPAPNYSLNSNPPSLTITQGYSATSTITMSPQNGFTGAVTLSATSTAGITASFSPSSVYGPNSGYTAQSSTMTVSVDSSVAPGSYTVTVTGISSSLAPKLAIPVTVNASPSQVPPAQTTIFGLQPAVFYGLVGGIVAVIAAAGGVTVVLRRRKS